MTPIRVAGEDTPLPVPIGLAVLGFAAALGAATAWTEEARAARGASMVEPPSSITGTDDRARVAPPSPAPLASQTPPSIAQTAPRPCEPLVVTFASGSHTPPKSATAEIAALGAWLAAHPERPVVVDGHADSQGTDHGNLALSRRRAAAVAELLVEAGVARDRLTTRGFGAFSPVEGETDDADANRRVVVRVRGTGECPRGREEERAR